MSVITTVLWTVTPCILVLRFWSNLQSALIRRTVQPFTESDDTRCCDNTICPPEDGHVIA